MIVKLKTVKYERDKSFSSSPRFMQVVRISEPVKCTWNLTIQRFLRVPCL